MFQQSNYSQPECMTKRDSTLPTNLQLLGLVAPARSPSPQKRVPIPGPSRPIKREETPKREMFEVDRELSPKHESFEVGRLPFAPLAIKLSVLSIL